MKKRIIFAICLALLLVALGVLAASAESATPALDFSIVAECDTAEEIEGALMVSKNDIIKVSVKTGEWNAAALCGGQFALQYDSNAMELCAVPQVDNVVLVDLDEANGVIKIQYIDDFPANGTPLIVSFRIKGTAHGDVSVTFDTSEFSVNYGAWLPGAANVKQVATLVSHTTAKTSTVVAPDCLNAGYTVYRCTHAGCTYTENDEPVPALGHDDSGDEPTCQSEKICARDGCNAVLAPRCGHKGNANVTCQEEVSCIWCGIKVADRGACVPGSVTSVCTEDTCCVNCGAVLTPKLGEHDKSGAGATCTTAKICAREGCGAVIQAALGHNSSGAADCETAETCLRCKEELTPATGHTTNAETATCKNGVICSACGKMLQTALGHAFGEWQLANGVDETDGRVRVCSRCGETEQSGYVGAERNGLSSTVIVLIAVGSALIVAIGAALIVFGVRKKKKVE